MRAVCPSMNLVAYSNSCYIGFYDWSTHQDITINTQSEELDEMWNGIVSVEFCGAYVLCVKTRSVELHPIPNEFLTGPYCQLPVFKHAMPDVAFRDVSVSSVDVSPIEELPTLVLSVSFLAHDLLRGLFLHRVRMRLSGDAIPMFNVDLLEAHSMGAEVVSSGGMGTSHGQSRGFVSACALGPQGKRGVWIERTRSTMRRRVVAFTADGAPPPPLDPTGLRLSEDDACVYRSTYTRDARHRDDPAGSEANQIDGRTVYEVASYDLRDDMTHCALAEVSGTVVLGTRSGDVEILTV